MNVIALILTLPGWMVVFVLLLLCLVAMRLEYAHFWKQVRKELREQKPYLVINVLWRAFWMAFFDPRHALREMVDKFAIARRKQTADRPASAAYDVMRTLRYALISYLAWVYYTALVVVVVRLVSSVWLVNFWGVLLVALAFWGLVVSFIMILRQSADRPQRQTSGKLLPE